MKQSKLSLNRRQFLVGAGGLLGAWLVGPEIARLISRLAVEGGAPYLVEVDRPKHQLWANKHGDEYLFTLGCSYADMEEPRLTWGQWLKRQGVDLSRNKEIRDYLTDCGLFEPYDENPWVAPDLNEDIPEHLLQDYLEWQYDLHDSPIAQAYRYLWRLHLADRKARGQGLGELIFIEGDHPGSNFTYVSTNSVAVLGGLQQRLLQLGQRVQLQVADKD